MNDIRFIPLVLNSNTKPMLTLNKQTIASLSGPSPGGPSPILPPSGQDWVTCVNSGGNLCTSVTGCKTLNYRPSCYVNCTTASYDPVCMMPDLFA